MLPTNALVENLARMQRVRGDRLAQSLDIHSPQGTLVGGPLPDPAWDAFFGSLQDKDNAAEAAGLRSTTNFGALAGLNTAMRGGRR